MEHDALQQQTVDMARKRSEKVISRLKDKTVRHFIREWREHRGFTQERLADRVDLSVSSISQLESGDQGYRQATLEALADALSCEPGDLLMRNPLIEDAVWDLQDQLLKATKAKREEVLSVVEVMLRKAG